MDSTLPDSDATPPPPPEEATLSTFVPPIGNYTYMPNDAGSEAFPDARTPGVDRLTTYGSAGPVEFQRTQGATLLATIETLAAPSEGSSCWKWHLDVHHSDSTGRRYEEEAFCARQGGLFSRVPESDVQLQVWPSAPFKTITTTNCEQNTTYLRWDMKANDAVWGQNCNGTAVLTTAVTETDTYTIGGANQYLGRENVKVGTGVEEAHRVRRNRTYTGRLNNTEVVEFFFAVKDGLPLRIHRATHLWIPIKGYVGIDHTNFDEDNSDWILKERPSGASP